MHWWPRVLFTFALLEVHFQMRSIPEVANQGPECAKALHKLKGYILQAVGHVRSSLRIVWDADLTSFEQFWLDKG